MLTYPSDPPPQIVGSMDEVAVPQNHFCSAPARSQPSPPLPLFSSITPSSAIDGISGNRRRDGIQRAVAETHEKQSIVDAEAVPKLPAQNLPLSKRQRECGRTGQASDAKHPRIDREREAAFQDGFDAGLPEEGQNLQKNSQNQTNISPAENVAPRSLHSSAQNLDIAEPDTDTCVDFAGDCDIPNVSSPNKWVIGPLFQSLKSKISSFTEIVITPVKVFRATSYLPSMVHTHNDGKHQSFGMSSIKHSAPGGVFDPQAQSGRETEAMNVIEGAHEAQAVHNCCKRVSMDLSAQNSEQADECPTTGTEKALLVPLQQSPSLCADSVDGFQSAGSVFTSSVPLYLSVAVSASQESKLSIPSAEEELKGKQAAQVKSPLRKGRGNGKNVRSKTLVSDQKKVGSDPEMTDVPVTNPLNSDKGDPSHDETVLSESDGRKSENNHLVGQSLQIDLSNSVNGKILRSTTDNQPLEALLNPETLPAVGHRRPKRDLKGDAQLENTVKRKRVRAGLCGMNTQSQEPQRPTRKRQAVSASANKKGKHDGEMLTTINEAVGAEADSFGAPSLENHNGEPEESWKGSNHKVKPKKTRRLKTQTSLSTPDLAGDSMDLETTIQIRSAKQAQPEGLAEVLCHPRELHRTRKCRGSAKTPQKRKSSTCADSENSPKALPVELSKVKPADMNTSDYIQAGRSCKVGLKRPSQRPKKALRSSTPEGSHLTKEAHLRTKENGSQGSKSTISVSPVYFEMTPCESSPQSGPLRDCYVKLGQDVMLAEDERTKVSESVADEPFPTNSESTNHSSASVFSLHSRPRKENQRRKCSVRYSGVGGKVEVANGVSKDDSNLATAGKRTLKIEQNRQLLRSFSCPEISTLRSSDVPWNSLHLPHHTRIQPSQQHARSGPLFPHPAHKSVHRARRHTVCTVELEREIAPLCLRKEVYPSRRSPPYDTSGQYPPASHALSPSTSLSALASCFLSSPLAFLSKKAQGRGASASPGSSSHIFSPTSSSFLPLSSTTKHLSGFIQQPDSSGLIMEPRCESGQRETDRRQQCEVDDEAENTSSSSQELEDVGLREEKALSDSEVKVLRKHEERSKVSSIRIRKTLPKPQNNLTPMGLPKAVRVKKKDFSLEEIYTNKNFNKPRESRLETIFEVPTSRKNGSVSSFGQKRIRRFLEFLEVGEARKPKKTLVGVGKAGASTSRTRRGGFLKDAAPLSVQDVDSLLCAKLHQLNLWLIQDQSDG